MLIIDEELLGIEAAVSDLVVALLDLELVAAYKQAKSAFMADQKLQDDLADFQVQRLAYEDMAAYAKFSPEYKDKRRQLFALKRSLDMNEKVVALRQAEVAVQEVLADLTKEMAGLISETIFVDTGLPLAPHKPKHKFGDSIKEGK